MTWVPLYRSGSGGGTQTRPFGVSCVTPYLGTGASQFSPDMKSFSCGTAPAVGNLEWHSAILAGSGATAGRGGASAGGINLATGATSGTLIEIREGRFTTTAGNSLPTTSMVFQVKLSLASTGTTSEIAAVGLIPTSLLGADFITDPDTVLAASEAIIVHHSSAAYAGGNANAVSVRAYGGGGLADSLELAIHSTATVYTVEIVRSSATPTVLSCYLNGSLVGTVDYQPSATIAMIVAGQLANTAAANRNMTLQGVYLETL